MTLKVNMANGGSTGVDFLNDAGTVLAQIRGYDDGSSNGHLELYTTLAGVASEKIRIDSSGSLLVGLTSNGTDTNKVRIAAANANTTAAAQFRVENLNGQTRLSLAAYQTSNTVNFIAGGSLTNPAFVWSNNDGSQENMRLDSSGNLLVGTTSSTIGGVSTKVAVAAVGFGVGIDMTGDAQAMRFARAGTAVGSIAVSSGTTTYNTSSDYRLKENIVPMTGALDKVAALKPCTYTWKETGSSGQGFIAHELQSVVPDCVTGEKDATDENGNPEYQGIDTSFLVATLTAAIQEQQAIITSQSEAITQLRADVKTLKGAK